MTKKKKPARATRRLATAIQRVYKKTRLGRRELEAEILEQQRPGLSRESWIRQEAIGSRLPGDIWKRLLDVEQALILALEGSLKEISFCAAAVRGVVEQTSTTEDKRKDKRIRQLEKELEVIRTATRKVLPPEMR